MRTKRSLNGEEVNIQLPNNEIEAAYRYAEHEYHKLSQDKVNTAKSLFGILPDTITLEEAKEEYLSKI